MEQERKIRRGKLALALLVALAGGGLSPLATATGQRASGGGGDKLSDRSAAAERSPGNVDAQIAYGRALIRSGQLDRARKRMERAVKLSKGSPQALFEAARVRFAEDHYRRSRAACAVLRRAHRKHILYDVCMARAFLVWRRASRAEGHIQAALAKDPEHLEALFALAEMQRMRSEFEDSEATYRQVLSRDPSFAEANLGLARMFLVQGRRADAEQTLRDGLTRHPDHPQIMYLLGTVVPPAEAVGLFQRALAARPKWNDAEAALGGALLATGRHQQAELRLRAALKRDPKDGIAQGKLGETLIAQGKLQEAENALLKAIAVQPSHPDAALALARLYARTGRDEDAFEYFRKAAGMRATDSGPLVEAAELARKNGRSVLAAAFVERALERHPNQPRALAMRGDLLAARGDRAGAIASYRQALSSKPTAGKRHVNRTEIEKKLRALE